MTGPVGSTPLHQKLRLQPDQRALLLNAPEGFPALLAEMPFKLQFLTEPAGDLDFALYFAPDRESLAQTMPEIVAHLVHDGLLWVAYPKTSSGVDTDLSRDIYWEIMRAHSFKAVTQVHIDETWTAMRFRLLELIGK